MGLRGGGGGGARLAARGGGAGMSITVAIPTYNRAAIVIDTVRRLLALDPPPEAIIVVDQTAQANAELARLHDAGRIRVIRLDAPSIPRAMNTALTAAATPLVLFVDDDVEPSPGLVAGHEEAHRSHDAWA